MRGKIVGQGDKTRYLLEGEEVSREAFFAAFPPPIRGLGAAGLVAWKRPLLSEALAVHPKQIKEATERNHRHGVRVTYAPDGRAILPDRAARRDLMRLEGAHDNSGGYGDDTGGSRVSVLPPRGEPVDFVDLPCRQGMAHSEGMQGKVL